jgi:serine/threonine protein kinase
LHRYEKIAKIGQGTFGEVFKAKCKTDKNKIVALKKVLMENEKEVRCISINQGCGSGSAWIRINSSCWIQIQEGKMTHKKRKK